MISESLDDYTSADLDAFAVGARDALTSDVRQLNVRGPERRKVGGFDAIQFDIEGVHDVTRVRYLFTVVLGRRAIHQIVAWSPRSAFNRKVFDELLKGFRERPGAAAEPRAEPSAAAVSPARVIGFRPAGFKQSATSDRAD